MMAMPGESLHYVVHILEDQPPFYLLLTAESRLSDMATSRPSGLH